MDIANAAWLIYTLGAFFIIGILIEYFVMDTFYVVAEQSNFDYKVFTNERGRRFIYFTYDYIINDQSYSSSQLIQFPNKSNLDNVIENSKVKVFKYYLKKSRVTSKEIEKIRARDYRMAFIYVSFGCLLVYVIDVFGSSFIG